MAFEIIPALDLRGGRCVRLAQGDFDRETAWADEPVEVARRWERAGARVLHVVDLDGAREGEPRNLEALRAIRAATSLRLQYGGGLRTDHAVAAALEAGADRVVVGTALVVRPRWVEELCRRYGERVMASIDARQGKVAVQGWTQASALLVAEVVDRANQLGLRRALVTDIERDGMLGGPNLEALRAVVAKARFEVIASGGISSLEDVGQVRQAGAAGAIIGQALYAGRIDLGQALASVDGAQDTGGGTWA